MAVKKSKALRGQLSQDVSEGHLKGKKAHEVHAEHNRPETPEENQCMCQHCEEHRGTEEK